MASLRKLTVLSPLFLCAGGGTGTVGDGWSTRLGIVSSAQIGLWETNKRKKTD